MLHFALGYFDFEDLHSVRQITPAAIQSARYALHTVSNFG